MALMLWTLLVIVAAVGGALAALTVVPARRAAGLIAVTAAVAALLMVLGLDLPAAAWLGVGGAAALLAVAAGHPATGERRSGPASLLWAGVAAGLLFAVLYRTVLQVDWNPRPPGAVAGQSSVVGGRLLTEDLALLGLAVLLLTVALAAVSGRRPRRTGPGGAS